MGQSTFLYSWSMEGAAWTAGVRAGMKLRSKSNEKRKADSFADGPEGRRGWNWLIIGMGAYAVNRRRYARASP